MGVAVAADALGLALTLALGLATAVRDGLAVRELTAGDGRRLGVLPPLLEPPPPVVLPAWLI